MQVRSEHILRLSDLARENQIRETLMCRDKFLAALEGPHHDPAIAVGLIVKVGMCGEQPF